MRRMTRRSFVQASLAALGVGALHTTRDAARANGSPHDPLVLGMNYPWIGYGHDFGANAWGHDGIITGGWTYQTFPNSRGFTDTRRSTAAAHTGNASLCITADLVGQHPNKSQGEVYVDLRIHGPRSVVGPIDVTDCTFRCRLLLPPGSAGPSNAANGIQLFFKSLGENDQWSSFYTRWANIQPGWEGTWQEFSASVASPSDSHDPEFDPRQVVAIGVKIAINGESTATITGPIYLDDVRLDCDPPRVFDFEQLEAACDFGCLGSSNEKRVVRVFVFADGRASPEFLPGGAVDVPGLDRHFFDDFDALLDIARRQHVLLMPVLLDFWWCDTPRVVNGVQLGGHSDIIRDTAKRRTFLDNVVGPLARRYAASTQIAAWDIMNEPEWAVRELATNFRMGDPVALDEMRSFVADCAAVFHSAGTQQVTLGSARRQWLPHWMGCGLDLYQFHWYDHFAAEEPFPWPACAQLGLDKPCIIGEVPTATTAHACQAYVEAARAGGYAMLLFWSYRAQDEFSDFLQAARCVSQRCVSYLPLVLGRP
jgi:hypothetical protein